MGSDLGSVISSINLWGFLVISVVVWGIGDVINRLSDNRRKASIAEQNAVLKQTMLQKNMTADEIERVLKAGGNGRNHADA